MIDRLREELTQSIGASYELGGRDHPVPSPSGAYHCLREQWYRGKGAPITNKVSARTVKNMMAGTFMEPFWRDALVGAGYGVIEYRGRIPIFGEDGSMYTTGAIDGIVQDEDKRYLLELKNLGLWSFQSILDDGLKEGEPTYYLQVQLYLHACEQAGLINTGKAIFLAGMADSTAMLWYRRRFKKDKGDPPDFYIEIIEKDDAAVQFGLERLAEVNRSLAGDEVPAREFDPMADKFPCGYCQWQDQCIVDNGAQTRRPAIA